MIHSSSPLPPLDALRAFEAAARLGSFSAAANDLHLTHGAISRQVAKLEHWLGERLFDRQARGVALTPQGQRLHQRTSEAFALIADSSDRWIERKGAAIVRLTSIPSVSSLWLMPRLRAFEEGEPSLRIEFVVEHRNIDLEAEGIDLAIRCGRGSLPGRISIRLFEEHCFPIASPALAGSFGPGTPERLLKYPLVHDSDASGWRAWFAAQGMDYRPRPQDRRFEDYNLVLDAAAHGLGIALARPPLAGDALRTGRVVAVDPRTALNPVSYWLDRPQSRLRPSAAELARRITREAGLSGPAVQAFLSA
ncbi:LysR substrate-binding domain-containing protein [Microvirga sp. CF3016]|uniref:LysR substrate-binding domain-containing protein n=1 Tax=Microvirga sp. CF3016 TaxID=3110181 RepID=UPI002E79ED1C|nr:LysR substrate-binding domain-containing protein [Microvirga sp. CF3016]MEE1611937.1 LysR substrate-binding domain-containing protein [Microvirga sp. CF3016]